MNGGLLLLAAALGGAVLLGSSGTTSRRADRYALVKVPGYGGKTVFLRNDAADALTHLIEAARRDGIREPLLLPLSGYRTQAEQERVRQRGEQQHGSEAGTYTARAGHSAHQTGRAADLYLGPGKTDPDRSGELRQSAAYRWLVQHAAEYGFFPYLIEPWHWEFGQPHDSHGDLVAAEIAAGRKAGYLT